MPLFRKQDAPRPRPRTRRRRLPVPPPAPVVVGLLLAALATPATSLAAWDAPVDVSDPGADAFAPQVALSIHGDGVIAWQRDGAAGQEVQAATVSDSGAIGTVHTLSAGGSNERPAVAVDEAGNGLVVWRRTNGGDVVIQSNTLSVTGVPGLRQTLSDPAQDADDPAVGMDEDGDALIAWEYGTGNQRRIQAVTRSAGAVLGIPATLPATGGAAFIPEVAMAAGGAAVIAWLGDDGTSAKVRALTVSPAGVLGPLETLSTAPVDAENVGVGIDDDGDAVVSWLRFTNQHFRVHARTLSGGSAVGGQHTLSTGGQDAFRPDVAVAADGSSVVTWQRFDGDDFRVQAVPLSAAGVPGTVETLSASGSDGNDPDAAIDADGDSVITWDRSGDARIHARTITASGSVGTRADISDAGQPASQAQVAVDAGGDAVAVWARNDGSDEIVQAATGP